LINIFPLTKEYIPLCAELDKECFSEPWSEGQFLESLENEYSLFLVAELYGIFAGFISVYIIFDEGQILNIAVSPIYRGKEIGKALILEAEKLSKEKNVKKLTLELRESNFSAKALYDKCGYTVDGIRKGFYDKPKENAILMTKEVLK
jgi:ribosomal-protein-alanine N-acetyltransferase